MQRERRQLARKRHPAQYFGPVQRLLPETILCEIQAFCAAINDGKREHAIQARCQPLTPLLVTVNENLRVGMTGAKHLTEPKELLAQFDVVVDLAVEDYPDSSILIPHRLMAAGNINDSQAPMAEMHTKLIVDPDDLFIRPAMASPHKSK
jgi:hypothetical protein